MRIKGILGALILATLNLEGLVMAQNLELIGSYDPIGTPYKIFVQGDYAYINEWEMSGYLDGFEIVDISDPPNPAFVAAVDSFNGGSFGIFVSGNYLYIAEHGFGFRIYDITMPLNPLEVGYSTAPGSAADVIVAGDYAYIADWDHGLKIFDISDRTSPILTGSYATPWIAQAVSVLGSYAYVADNDSGLIILDVSNPSNPQYAGSFNTVGDGDAQCVVVNNDYSYIAFGSDGLQIVDVSDPSSPIWASEVTNIPAIEWLSLYNGNIYAVSNLGYCLKSIDISQPTSPILNGNYNTNYQAHGVFAANEYIYLTDSDSLYVLQFRTAPKIIHISIDGDDLNGDGSASNPFRTIQYGINMSIDSDTVLVHSGSYIENVNFNGHNIVLGSQFLTTGDTAYITQTVIDGGSAGSVVTFENGEDSTAIIAGFTIRNGDALSGGGIHCENSSPDISNNVISGNYAYYVGGGISCAASASRITDNAINGNFAAEYGGGISCGGSSPKIRRNAISGNTSYDEGGGIYSDHTSSPVIDSNSINNNTAAYRGGGIFSLGESSPNVIFNNISGNSADLGGGICHMGQGIIDIHFNTISQNSAIRDGGGICYNFGVSSFISNNLINENNAGFGGGGIYCGGILSHPRISRNRIVDNISNFGGGVYSSEGYPTIVFDTISGNSSNYHGGGIYCDDSSSPDIYMSVICGNIAAGNGGGIYSLAASPLIRFGAVNGNSAHTGGGIYCNESSFEMSYNRIFENSAFLGGGIAFDSNSTPDITSNTFTENTAAYRGGGLYGAGNSVPVLLNTIIWANTADSGYNGIYLDSSSVSVYYSDIQDTLWPGTGNINCDPVFCGSDTGNFDLNIFSCCLGAGSSGVYIGARGLGCSNCMGYVTGDVNDSGDYNGLDIVYGVSFFKGGPTPLHLCDCTPGDSWYAAGDVNGSCNYNGLDITYGVSFFKGGPGPSPCPDCSPVE